MMDRQPLKTFGTPYDIEATIQTLLAWEPRMPVTKLFRLTEKHLSYPSPETRKRYRSAIYGAFIPHNGEVTSGHNPLAQFVKLIPSRKARTEVLFYHILLVNRTILETNLFLRTRFEREEIDRVAVRKFLTDRFASPDPGNKTGKTIFRVLRDFGLITRGKPERILLRAPELTSLAYALYHHYGQNSVVAPSIEEIRENGLLLASFFANEGIMQVIETGNGRYWRREQRPPFDRVLLHYGTVHNLLSDLQIGTQLP